MSSSLDRGAQQQRYEDAGLSDLRRVALVRCLFLLLALAFLLLVLDGVYITEIDVSLGYVALALGAVVAISFPLLARGLQRAAAALVVGLVGVILLAVWLLPGAPSAAALGIVVLIATVLLGNVAGLVTLAVGGAAIGGLTLQTTSVPLSSVVMLTFGLGGLVLACSVVLWRSFYTVLDWSWASYHEAQTRTAELRERQVELGRLNQSLVLAYEQIKRTSAQLERARQAAEEARRLKAEFAASVSHELRTPLNLIIGLSELMVVTPHAGTPPLPEVYRADVEAIYRNACHISNLIDDVLDLSQIEAHHLGLLKEWTTLSAIVSQATTTVRTLFENTGLSLGVDLPEDLPPLFVDPVRIRQILINLLNNAVRFTEEGGVTITARRDADQVLVEVADTGVGIPPDDLPGVFLEFWRSGEPRRGRRGSGLGLAVSKRFAELHGGSMSVRSRVGEGSVFTLALPIGDKAVVQDPALAQAIWQRLEHQSPDRPSVVLVGLEPEVVRVFQRHLDGCDLVVAPSVARAVSLATAPGTRAIVVDKPSRRDAIRRALQAAPVGSVNLQLPILTCPVRTSAVIAQELGVAAYLVKPVSRPQLQRTFRRLRCRLHDVVLVDDDPEMLHLLTRMISAIAPRCQVRVATDGHRALDLLSERVPGLLVLDLLMPELDGYGMLGRLKADRRFADLPVVVVSARGAEETGLVAESIEISQSGGLHLGEICRWVRSILEARPGPDPGGAAPARREAPHGSPAY